MIITIWTGTGEGVKSMTVAKPYSGQTIENVGIGSEKNDLYQSQGQPTKIIEGTYEYYVFIQNTFLVTYIDSQISAISMLSN